jgi:uncharacterized protein YuzE
MNWKFDSEADAAYLQMAEGSIARTVILSENVVLDVDKDGRALGLEVLGVSGTGLSGLVAGSPAR